MTSAVRVVAMAMLATATSAGAAHGKQTEQQRINAIQQAMPRTGYTTPVVIGHGTGPFDPYFIVTATHADSGVLVLVRALEGDRAATQVEFGAELERAKTPADLGVRGVTFAPFLGDRNFFIVNVGHQPFMLETTHTFNTLHVIRLTSGSLSVACDIDGDAFWSTSKGLMSQSTKASVTIVRVGGAAGSLTFDVTVTETTSITNGSDIPPTTKSARQRYELSSSGMCRRLPQS